MTTDFGSTVPRRQLGRYLRRLREDGQITIKAAAEALEWSPQKIWRIENGAVAMRSHDVETMCRIYGARPDTTEALVTLARETKARGWGHEYSDAIAAGFHLFIGLENAASRVRQYQPTLIPGLLQTKAYVHGLNNVVKPDASESDLDRWTALRLQRQSILTRRLPPPPHLETIINEEVLRRSVPDRDAMAGQLIHLMDVGELPHVSVRILPIPAGLPPAAGAGTFAIFDFAPVGGREAEPSTVHVEVFTGGLYLDGGPEMAAYAAAWSRLDSVALDEGESRKLIKAVAEEDAP